MGGVYCHLFVDVSQSRICPSYLFKELCFIDISAYKLFGTLLYDGFFFDYLKHGIGFIIYLVV